MRKLFAVCYFISVTLLVITISCKKKAETVNEDEEPYVLPAGWQEVPSPSQIRTRHAAVLMEDGKVMISGGQNQTTSGYITLNTCEIYDPVTNSWTPAGNMIKYRSLHSMLTLKDGRIFVFGGFGTYDYYQSGEVYNPATNTWILTPEISDLTLAGPPLLLLPDGNVLIFSKNSSYIYKPDSNLYVYCSIASLINSGEVIGSALVNINDSTFMVIGGGGISPHNTSRIFINGTSEIYAMNYNHSFSAALLLPDSTILLSHGRHTSREHPELFDLVSRNWLNLDIMYDMFYGKLFLTHPGKVLAFGDVYMQEYDIANRSWTRKERPVACWNNGVDVPAVMLNDGKIFITGGWDLEKNPDPATSYIVLSTQHQKTYIYTP